MAVAAALSRAGFRGPVRQSRQARATEDFSGAGIDPAHGACIGLRHGGFVEKACARDNSGDRNRTRKNIPTHGNPRSGSGRNSSLPKPNFTLAFIHSGKAVVQFTFSCGLPQPAPGLETERGYAHFLVVAFLPPERDPFALFIPLSANLLQARCLAPGLFLSLLMVAQPERKTAAHFSWLRS
jgi:hypothetical protein